MFYGTSFDGTGAKVIYALRNIDKIEPIIVEYGVIDDINANVEF